MTIRYLDVSDVVEYFSYNATASGIQRVQLEFIRHFSKSADGTTKFVIEDAGAFGFVVVANDLLMRLVKGVDDGSLDRDAMLKLLTEIRGSVGRAVPRTGDIFFVSGAFWASSSTLRSLWNAKKLGAQVGFLCYDLIPIRNAEFCDAGLSIAFRTSFESVCQIVDFIFTISVHVKHDVDRLLASIGLKLPVIALPLAHELAASRGGSIVSPEVAALSGKRYVLFVSTIEARKNHAYALTVWQRLIERGVPDVPDMVWVGRPGWLVNDLMERINRLGNLDGKLKIMSRLSDADLATLYQNCWFTLYPSLAEGWGLPVAESLVFGKPSIVSQTTSLPEVGGDFVWYIDPDNVTECVDLVDGLLRDPERIEKAALRIKLHFQPRLWKDVCRDLQTNLKRLGSRKAAPRPLPTVKVPPGTICPAGGNTISGAMDVWTARERAALESMFDDGWYAAEAWGRWMKGLGGGFRLEPPHADGDAPYLVLLTFNVFDGWLGTNVALHCLETGEEAIIRAKAGRQNHALVSIRLPPGKATLMLRADRSDAASAADPRKLSLGMVAFGFAPSDDVAATERLRAQASGGFSVEAKAVQVGAKSRLQPKAVILEKSWRMRLVERAMREGPRQTSIRTLKRLTKLIEK